jgi:hypothetical protein
MPGFLVFLEWETGTIEEGCAGGLFSDALKDVLKLI